MIAYFQFKKLSKNEAKCKTVLVKMSFIYMRIKNHFHINGLAINLALKQMLWATFYGPLVATSEI